MSLNSTSNEVNLRRDSYEVRICDDLSKELLKYLSLEDRLRFECLSKQFQKILFQTSMVLIIESEEKNCLEKTEYLLKRFPSINSIRFNSSFLVDSHHLAESVIQLLLKYCNNLFHISPTLILYCNLEIIRKFSQKFGPNLLELNFCLLSDEQILSFLSPMKESNAKQMILRFPFAFIYDIHFKQLKSLEFRLSSVFDMNCFDVMAQSYAENIKRLVIDCSYISQENKSVLYILEKFENLVHLEFNSIYNLNDESFGEHLTQMSLNSIQLKSLSLKLNVNTLSQESLEPITHFKSLKRLKLWFWFNCENPKVSLNSFKGFRHLIYLYIRMNPVNYFEDLTDIDINLPNLQYLYLFGFLITSKETANILSRLTDLKIIELHLIDSSIAALIETNIRKKCKRITKIKLE